MDAPAVVEAERARLGISRAELDVREANMNLAAALPSLRVRRFVNRLEHLRLVESKQRSDDHVRSAALPGDDLQYTVTGYLYNMSESQRLAAPRKKG